MNGNGNGNSNSGIFSFFRQSKKFGIDQAIVVYGDMAPLVDRFGAACQKVKDDNIRGEFHCLVNEVIPTSITCAAKAQGAEVCIHEEGAARINGCVRAIDSALESHSYYEEKKQAWINRLDRWIQAFRHAIHESQRRTDRLIETRRAEQDHLKEVMSFFNGHGVNNGTKELS